MTSRNRQWRAAVSRDGILLSTLLYSLGGKQSKRIRRFSADSHRSKYQHALQKIVFWGIFSTLPAYSISDRGQNKIVIILLPLSLDYCFHISFWLVGWLMSPILTQNIERKKWLRKSKVLTKFLTGTSEVLEIHLP